MMARRKFTFLKDAAGGVTVEFVAIFPALLLTAFFVFEMIVSMYYVGGVEKAAQLGARMAITSNYAVTTLTPGQAIVGATSTTVPGALCIKGNCTSFTTQTCVGSTLAAPCSAADFNAIVNRMRSCTTCTGISSLIQASNVTITYSDSGLGFATGNIVPIVTVTVSGLTYPTLTTNILTNFMKWTNTQKGKGGGTSPLPGFPTITVTMTGEDMSSAGAS
jgi:Flp pilus assembly protein TadG